ncbi:MAG: Ig-like domain-containing protein [Acidobacteriota bacterium]
MTRQIWIRATRLGAWAPVCGLALAVAMTTSCSKAALVAPTASTLTLNVSRTTAGLSASVSVVALVYESSGQPVHDGTVVSFFTTLGTFSAAQATTSGGQAIVQLLTGSQSGTAEISAVSGAAKLASTVKVTIGAAAAGRVELTASPTVLPSGGGSAILIATVTDANGNRLSGIPITFYTDYGTLEQNGTVTDGNGQVQNRVSVIVKSTVTASVSGGTGGVLTSNAVVLSLRTPPNAAITSTTATGLEATLTYTAYAGSDGVAVRSVTLYFGDGSTSQLLPSGTNQTAVHRYAADGTYIPVLTVTDMAGETAIATVSLAVAK